MTRLIIGISVLIFSGYAEARLNSNVSSVSQMSGVQVNTSGATNCFPPQLIGFIDELRTRFGNVSINSAYRSASRNRRVGGARRSQHINCNAIDFAVPGVSRDEVKEFLTANFRGRAGVGFYCNNRFHLDVGNPRQWGGCQPTSREIARANQRYSRYLATRNRQRQNEAVRNASYTPTYRTRGQGHGGLHRHQGDQRLFIQRASL